MGIAHVGTRIAQDGFISLLFCWLYRQPLVFFWTIPGAVLVGPALEHLTFPQVVGAYYATGLLMLILGLSGWVRRIMAAIPMPIVMAMVSGVFLQFGLDLVLAVKVVKNMDEAMEHIAQYGSRHTEAIVTSDYGRSMRFLKEVDAGAVLVNASTRLNDGYQFGLGAEIGISTSRIHARGPMGLEELTCFKFIVLGSGQLRE